MLLTALLRASERTVIIHHYKLTDNTYVFLVRTVFRATHSAMQGTT